MQATLQYVIKFYRFGSSQCEEGRRFKISVDPETPIWTQLMGVLQNGERGVVVKNRKNEYVLHLTFAPN